MTEPTKYTIPDDLISNMDNEGKQALSEWQESQVRAMNECISNGERVVYAPGKTIQIASVELGEANRSLDDAFAALYDLSPDAWFMLPAHDADRMIMDGKFTLDDLRRIVTAWERFKEKAEAQP